MNFARLNHLLIPGTSEERDRLRRSWLGRSAVAPAVWAYGALTDEGRFLFVVGVVAGFAGLDVEHTQNHLLWCAVAALLAASLLVRPLFRMDGVRLDLEAPRRAMVGEEARFTLTLTNDGARDHWGLRIEGPLLPWDGKWSGEKPALEALPAGSRRTLTVGVRFCERGWHHLDPFTAAALVPLGVAQGRSVVSHAPHFLVTPRIAAVRGLKLPGGHRYQPGGVALASKTGESRELFGVRPYRSGDRIRDLHARSWARTGAPVVREYQQEYFARVGVIVDTDAGASSAEPLEPALSLAAGIVAHLSRGEALIDLLVTGNQIHPLTLGRSLGFLEQALDHLACVKPGPHLDADALMQRLSPHLARLSSVVIVALTWDEARRRLVERIRREGTACRALLVADAEAGEGVATVRPEVIRSGQAILL